MNQAVSLYEPIFSFLGDDPDLADLVELFVDEMPARIMNFRECFGRGDSEALRIATHQLKGAAGSYGFSQLTPVLHQLETLLKQNAEPEAVQQSLEIVILFCQRTRAGIK